MKHSIQRMGRFLSRMVMPNISAFIAWGILTALFHQDGWIPNAEIGMMINPMIIYALPILIAYSGGKAIYQTRGGVIGVIATMGLIAGSDIPMFIGAMLVGPLSAWLLKKLDSKINIYIPTGFEMLVSNFSSGLLGMLFALIAFKVVGPMIETVNVMMETAVAFVLERGLLFVSSLFIEPGKILFLNNAINHGVLGPLGIQDALVNNHSIFFLLEANPGPGLGVLLAYWFFSKGVAKSHAPSAVIIHFFGGIHEIYFPYVLMRPLLFGAVILGGMSGVLTFQILGAGLIATPSPGSIFALMALASKSSLLPVLAGVVISTVVSFLVSFLILRNDSNWQIEDEQQDQRLDIDQIFASYSGPMNISSVVFACDAGMGSSAIGASLLAKGIRKSGLKLPVENVSIDAIPKDAVLVVTYKDLIHRSKRQAPNALHIGLGDFLNKEIYEQLLEAIIKYCVIEEGVMENKKPMEILMKSNILLKRASVSMEEAIEHAGRLLFESGYVTEGYIKGMLAREEKFSTYIGNQVAIPHGENAVKDCILASGIVVIQYPEGVRFGDDKIAKLVIGIAGKGNEHIQLLANIAEAIEEEEILNNMLNSEDPTYIYNLFSNEGMTTS